MSDGMSALEKLLDHLVEQGGRLSITWDPADGAVVAYEFGREAEDSPMYGAAAYAGCDTILEALEIVADQVNA